MCSAPSAHSIPEISIPLTSHYLQMGRIIFSCDLQQQFRLSPSALHSCQNTVLNSSFPIIGSILFCFVSGVGLVLVSWSRDNAVMICNRSLHQSLLALMLLQLKCVTGKYFLNDQASMMEIVNLELSDFQHHR